jgi:SpoIID/LytB domain protein
MLITIKLTRQVNLEHFGTSEIQLDIEEYLKGVVGSEIGNASLEACRAQAVAARTFALIRVS